MEAGGPVGRRDGCAMAQEGPAVAGEHADPCGPVTTGRWSAVLVGAQAVCMRE